MAPPRIPQRPCAIDPRRRCIVAALVPFDKLRAGLALLCRGVGASRTSGRAGSTELRHHRYRARLVHHSDGISAGPVVVGQRPHPAEAPALVEADRRGVIAVDLEVDAADAAVAQAAHHRAEQRFADALAAALRVRGEAVNPAGGSRAVLADEGHALPHHRSLLLGHEEYRRRAALEVLEL